MRVYKFLPAEFALQNLIKRQIKISEFHDMNDPFELWGVRLSDPDLHHVAALHMMKRYGALCFSTGWKNPMLWSLYGDKHKGICLGFDIGADVEIKQPSYVIDRQQFDASVLQDAASLADALDVSDVAFQKAENIVTRMLETKFKSWRCEEEMRILIRLNNYQKQGPLYLAELNETIRPVQMILGSRCSVTPEEIQTAINGYSPPITVIPAMLSPTSFEVIEDPRRFTPL